MKRKVTVIGNTLFLMRGLAASIYELRLIISLDHLKLHFLKLGVFLGDY